MEANVPEKIYVTEGMLFMTNPEITLRENDNEIEYIRADAFIEKTCEFIKKRFYFDDSWHVEGETSILDKVIEDFKNYIKGE